YRVPEDLLTAMNIPTNAKGLVDVAKLTHAQLLVVLVFKGYHDTLLDALDGSWPWSDKTNAGPKLQAALVEHMGYQPSDAEHAPARAEPAGQTDGPPPRRHRPAPAAPPGGRGGRGDRRLGPAPLQRGPPPPPRRELQAHLATTQERAAEHAMRANTAELLLE